MLKKIFLSFIFLFITTTSCKSYVETQDYYTYFQREVEFPSLGLTIKPTQEPLTNIEKSYITKDYGSVVSQNTFNLSWSAQTQYIYLRSLLHLKEWDKLYTIVKNQPLKYSDSLLGVYLCELALQSFIQSQDTNLVQSAYKQFQRVEAKYPVDDVKKQNIQNSYAAFMNDKTLASTEGGFYFYRYDQEPQRIQDLYKSIRLKNPDAIRSASLKEFKAAIPKKQWVDFLKVTSSYNKSLYVELLKQLGHNETLASYYFGRSKYSMTLKYAPQTSFYYHASFLMSGNKKQAAKSVVYGEAHLQKMFYFLASYYFDMKDFTSLNRIFQKGYASKALRFLVVLGLEQKQYQALYKTLKLIEQRDFLKLGNAEKAMLMYWLAFLNEQLGQAKDSLKYYLTAATLYPNLYYGWQSLKSVEIDQLSVIFTGWKDIYKTKEVEIKDFMKKTNSIKLSDKDIELQRGLFFMKIREDEKGKKNIQLYTEKPEVNKEYSYYALATGYYANHRMDYFYVYMRSFLSRLQNTVGSYLFFEDLLPMLFPRKYEEHIISAAQRYGFQPSILESLILQESTYDYLALSWVGAQGLSQLMPATGAPILKKLYKDKVIDNQDIWDPKTNIYVGADYMNWLMNRVYKGYPVEDQLALAYASYNAGPKRIKKMYHRMQNRVNLPHFVESIDFAESRDYVQRLTFSKDIYAFLYHSR